jgi:transcriptional regulator with XRE-family HTH domain
MNLDHLAHEIGLRLKRIRKESNLSLKEVSFLLGQKSLNALSSFENGKRMPSIETLYKLSEIYNTEISELLPETSLFLKKKEVIRKEYSSMARKALEMALKE